MKALVKISVLAFMLSISAFSCSDSATGNAAPAVNITAAYKSIYIYTYSSRRPFTPLRVTATDSDGTIEKYEYSIVSDTSNGYLSGTDSATGKYYYSGSIAGKATISVTVTDNEGAKTTAEVTINILDTSVFKISDIEGNFTGVLNDGDFFGNSIENIGDLDGDGTNDIAVGACADNPGAVWILFLNSDGTVKSHQKISDTEGNFTGVLNEDDSGVYFGNSIENIGDLDGDGTNDIAVGAPYDDDEALASGSVWILFLNTDGTVKSHQKISNTEGNFTGVLDSGDYFGSSIANIGDLDEDGINDIAVGAYNDDDGGSGRGAVWILFLNADGTVKSHQKISDTEGNFTGELHDTDYFGNSIENIGDLDEDGINDIATGAYFDDDGGSGSGAVWILFLNSNGTVKSHQKISDTEGDFTGVLADGDYFGSSIANIGDFDGDGINDIAVGVEGDNGGALWILFLHTNGKVKSYQKISDTEGNFTGVLGYDSFGASVENIGDLDGDGINDIAVGAYTDNGGGTNRGAVWLLLLDSDGSVFDYE